MTGKYIIIDGGEGCGKDKQADLLIDYLNVKGYSCMRTQEPGGTPEAEEIRKLVLGREFSFSPLEELFLILVARSHNYRNVVIPSLKAGKIVIKTRGWPSTFAYQGYAGGIDLNSIRKLNQEATFGIMPDILFIIDIPAEKGLEKETIRDRFAAKGLGYHLKVNQGFLRVAQDYPEFSVVIPYRKDDIHGMQTEIRKYVSERLGV